MSDRYTQLLSEVNRNSHVVETVQLAPFTYMKVKCRLGDDEYIGIGFAKKSPDDTWCENHGADVARAKAIGHILVQIVDADHEHWLDYATEQYHKAEDARRKLEVAEKKIADMMDAMREAVCNAKVEGGDDMPKPKRFVTTGGSQSILLSAPNVALAQKLLNLAGHFGDSAKGNDRTEVWLYLNPCYDKREVLDWLRGQIHREYLSMRIEAEAAEFESKLAEAQTKMDEAEGVSEQEKPEQVP